MRADGAARPRTRRSDDADAALRRWRVPVGRRRPSAGDPARARDRRSLRLPRDRRAGRAALARSWPLAYPRPARRGAGQRRAGRTVRLPRGGGARPAPDSRRPRPCGDHRARPFPFSRQRRDRRAIGGSARLCPQGRQFPDARRDAGARRAAGGARQRRQHGRLSVRFRSRGRGGAPGRAARPGALAARRRWRNWSGSPITSATSVRSATTHRSR